MTAIFPLASREDLLDEQRDILAELARLDDRVSVSPDAAVRGREMRGRLHWWLGRVREQLAGMEPES